MIFKMLIRKREDTKPAEDQRDFSCVTAVKNRSALLEAKIPPVLIEREFPAVSYSRRQEAR